MTNQFQQQPPQYNQPYQPAPKKSSWWIWLVAGVAVLVALFFGVGIGSATQEPSAPVTVQAPPVTVTAKPEPAPTVTVTAKPEEKPSEEASEPVEVNNAYDIAGVFPQCNWTDESTGDAEILASTNCQAVIGYSGLPGFGDLYISNYQGNSDFSGWYVVNGDTWIVVVAFEEDASMISELYGVDYEAL